MSTGILTGLEFESRLFQIFVNSNNPPIIRCSGAKSSDTEKIVQELVLVGCDSLLSFGIAGGLTSETNIGDLMIASKVIRESDRSVFDADSAWCKTLVNRLGKHFSPRVSVCIGTDTLIGSLSKKESLARELGGTFVDMESHHIAEVAHKVGVPFAVLRVISDTNRMRVPTWVTNSISQNGNILYYPLLVNVLKNISDWPVLFALKSSSSHARAVLKRVVIQLGPSLGRPSI